MMLVWVSLLLCMVLMSGGLLTLGIKEDHANVIVSSSCIDKERKALLDFKADLVDTHGLLYNWGSEEEKMDCCKWVGVRCNNQTGHVTELDFYTFFGFVGKISPSLLQLHQLQYLNLNKINFQSNHIPKFLGSFSNLRHLDISGANLSGPVPSSLGDLTSITHLDLSENQLGGVIPTSFGNSSSLVQLNLSGNLLNGSLPSFAGCASIKDIILHSNAFHGEVPNFTGCPLLQMLDLSGNRLSGNLPNGVGQLSNLEHLDVSSNSLQGVVSNVHFLNLTLLTYLDLSSNSLALDSRSLLRAPFYLKTIKLHSCKLGPSFPAWLKTQSKFTHLDISNAGISDGIPAWFWEDLPFEVKLLNLSSNDIKGTLPDIPSYLGRYPGMDLSYKYFQGSVPLLPSRLAALNLSGNMFSGNLSFLCQNDGYLTFLDLSNNLFSGSLPDCWLKFQQDLVILNLSNNNLSGEIPSSLGFLSHLEALYLRSNAFIGDIPVSLRNCTKLRFMDLGENMLSGIIPAWIGERLTELYVLVLQSNRFNGSLPTQLCWLYNLQLLDLSDNGFSGNIPRCFSNLTAMARRGFEDEMATHSYSTYNGTRHLPSPSEQGPSGGNSRYISYRALTLNLIPCYYYICPVPALEKALFVDNAWVDWKGARRSFGRTGLQLLKSIDLSSNNLSGKFPYEITSLVELISLNFSFNKLHGEFPKEMGWLKALESLDLSRNEFSGHIPSSLSQLNFLSYLDLSNNNLSGRIPTGPQLQRFNSSSYSGNFQLCGPPLTPRCGFLPPPATAVGQDDVEDEDEFWKSYYTGMGAGFAVGFCGICGVLFLNRRCRYLFFDLLSY